MNAVRTAIGYTAIIQTSYLLKNWLFILILLQFVAIRKAGSLWLASHFILSNIQLTHRSYIGTRNKIENSDEVCSYYRYPDLTSQSEYLAKAIFSTIQEDLFEELYFLQRYDELKKIQQIIDMPDKQLSNIIEMALSMG